MATLCQIPTPFSSSGKKHILIVKRPIDLESFFSSGLPGKLRFLLMSVTKEGTFKSISAYHFAHNLQQQIAEIQFLNRQRNGILLLEGRKDAQIAKIMPLKCMAGLQVKVDVHPT